MHYFSTTARFQAPIDFIIVSPGSEELLGTPASWEGVRFRLASYSLAEVLDLLGRISILIEKEEEVGDLEIQTLILSGLFGRSSPVFKRLLRFQRDLAKDGRQHEVVIFHEGLLANSVKAAVLAIPSSSASLPEQRTEHRRLGQALLIINSLTTSGAIPLEDLTNAGEDALELFMVANGVFNAGDSGVHEFARAAELYIRDRSHLNMVAGYRDLSYAIQDLTGLSPEKLWTAYFAIYAHLAVRSPDDMPLRGARLPVDMVANLLPGFSSDEVTRLLLLISQDESELRVEVAKRYSWETMKPLDFVAIARRPLVRIGDDYFVLGLRFLKEKLTTGLHHLFLDPETGYKSFRERQNYLTYMGYVWEDYVRETLERGYAGRNNVTFIGEDVIKRHTAGPSIDALIVTGNIAILVETKATLFTFNVRSGENMKGYLGKLEDMVFDAARQIDATIVSIENGLFTDTGIQGAQIRRYIPVVASLEPAMMNPFLVSRIDERLKFEGWLQNTKVSPLQILDPSEIELLDTGENAGIAMEKLLEEKAHDINLARVSFRNYLISRQHPILRMKNSYLAARYKELTDRALAHVRENSPRRAEE